ncbi:hypothetical protein P4736_28590, partial [Priestia megaterium]|uniref:hypothetical protein n=1 Tax=Priestia megaterium TaxID=1404 RepID=UPI00285264C1
VMIFITFSILDLAYDSLYYHLFSICKNNIDTIYVMITRIVGTSTASGTRHKNKHVCDSTW